MAGPSPELHVAQEGLLNAQSPYLTLNLFPRYRGKCIQSLLPSLQGWGAAGTVTAGATETRAGDKDIRQPPFSEDPSPSHVPVPAQLAQP